MWAQVSVMVPPPYNKLHDGYLKRFAATQKSSLLNVQQRLECAHKKGHLISVSLVVSRIESGGETCFMGVIKELHDESAQLTVSDAGARERTLPPLAIKVKSAAVRSRPSFAFPPAEEGSSPPRA